MWSAWQSQGHSRLPGKRRRFAFLGANSELLYVLVREFYRSDQRLSFAHAVTIGTARDQQMKSIRNLQIMLSC